MTPAPRLLHAAAVVACAVLLYAGSLDGGFHYDDFHSLVNNPHVRRLANLPSFLMDPTLFSADADKAMYRPLVLASYALNHALAPRNAPGYARAYHVANVLLHAGCALLVWGIGRRAGLGSAGALAAGLLFAAHPLATEPVNYVSSRSESLAALFFLASFLLLTEAGARRRRAGVACFAGGLVAFGCGLLAKEVAIVLPVVVLLAEAWAPGAGAAQPGVSEAGVRRRVRHLALWLVATAYLLVLCATRFLPHSVAVRPRGLAEQVWTQLKAGVYYLRLLSLPVGLNVEHQFAASPTPWAPAVVASGLLLASLGYLAVRHLPPRWRLWPAWACLTLLPSTLVPLNVLVNEHRLYLPLAGLSLLAGQAWSTVSRPTRARLAGVALLLISAALVLERNRAWSDELSLWSASAAQSPLMPRAHVHLGNALQERGHAEEARQEYERALALDPRHSAARTNLANLLTEAAARSPERALELRQRAAREYERVLSTDPGYAEALNNLGTVYLHLDEVDRAGQVLGRLVEVHPGFAAGWLNLGLVDLRRGDLGSAVEHLRRSLALEEDAEVRCQLGDALAQLGDLDGARREYEAALPQRPEDTDCACHLAEVLLVQGERQRAQGHTEAARTSWLRARGLLQAVLQQRPDLDRARLRLQQLEGRL